MIKKRPNGNGWWAVDVRRAGTYRIILRLFPPEADRHLPRRGRVRSVEHRRRQEDPVRARWRPDRNVRGRPPDRTRSPSDQAASRRRKPGSVLRVRSSGREIRETQHQRRWVKGGSPFPFLITYETPPFNGIVHSQEQANSTKPVEITTGFVIIFKEFPPGWWLLSAFRRERT